ncbi:MAG TPA: hypothetical protein VLA74_01310 [Nitrososphaeraceae archaeon]|nr:hypothetical protein [Nitrososphaeraceae archaeon]
MSSKIKIEQIKKEETERIKIVEEIYRKQMEQAVSSLTNNFGFRLRID